MPKPDRQQWLAVALLCGAFLYSLSILINYSLESGEIYAPYSSLRNDPLGAKALYESLAALPQFQLERNYKPPQNLPAATIFYLGLSPADWFLATKENIAEYEKIPAKGGRLILAIVPTSPMYFEKRDSQQEFGRRWGMVADLPRRTKADRPPRGTPRETAFSFQPRDPAWRTILARGDKALILERPFLNGSIVVVAESYLLSNEGLWKDRRPALLAAIVGPGRHIVFDEFHLNVQETGSVGTLLRRYRLESAVAVLFLLGGLFLWRNSSSFLPPRTAPSQLAVGADAAAGLARLLARGIPKSQLAAACVEQWRKSLPLLPYRQARHAALLPPPGTDPVSCYRESWRNIMEKS